jgi:hypothetical protein
MATLQTPNLSADPDSNEVATEINWIYMCMEDLDEKSTTYATDKAYYQQTVDDLLLLLDTARPPQDDYYNMNMDGGADGVPAYSGNASGGTPAGGNGAGSSASSAYSSPHSTVSSPVTPNPVQATGGKRSRGHEFEMSESKRQSANAKAAIPYLSGSNNHNASAAFPYPSNSTSTRFGQEISQPSFHMPLRPSQQGARNYLAPHSITPVAYQRPSSNFHLPIAGPSNVPPTIKPDPGFSASQNRFSRPRGGFIDLTQDNDDNEPPISYHPIAEPFPELDRAYRGIDVHDQRPGPVDAFAQDFLDPAALAEFLISTDGYASRHRSNLLYDESGLGQELFDDDSAEPLTPNPEAVAGLIENIKPDHDVPPEQREQTPVDMKSKLMPHQQLGLTWLKRMEQGTSKGGILADEMGLGKTVQALALILANPSEEASCKTTLIIAPVALMRQWEKEIQRHVKPDKQLKVYVYHGNNKKADFNALRQYDVVLTTFGTLQHENKHAESGALRVGKNKPALVGNECRWYRVIIDEAQCIKNRKSQISKATTELQSIHRLCLTGTPMMNSIDELYPLIRFLRVRPFNDWGMFNDQISKAVKNKHDNVRNKGMERLRVLIKSVMCRREKTTVVDGEQICQSKCAFSIMTTRANFPVYPGAHVTNLSGVAAGLTELHGYVMEFAHLFIETMLT